MIEVLVVVTILGILLALTAVAMVRVREASRSTVCQNNLRQVGLGFHLHSERDPLSRFCSGMFDFNREGCSDTHGWVADQMVSGLSVEEIMICPASSLKVNQKILDLYGIPTNDNQNRLTGELRRRYRDGMCGQTQWNGITGGGNRDEGFASTNPRTAERADLVSRYFLDRGLNTNYVTSWFLTHTMPRVRFSSGYIRTGGQPGQHGLRGRRETTGVLQASFLGMTNIVSSRIPLLGDAAPGDLDEAITPVDFQYGPKGRFAMSGSRTRTFATRGSLLSESSCEGPAFYHRTQRRLQRIGSFNSRLDRQLECDRNDDCRPPTGSSGNLMYLQSTREWMAIHGGGARAALNLLFADGSVRSFQDRNGDRLLNPGFPIPSTLTDQEKFDIGYIDGTVELPSAQVFSGVFLVPQLVNNRGTD